METKSERKGTTLGEVKEWLKEHGPEDVRNAAVDFAEDVGRLYEAMCVLYEENRVPLSMLGVGVSLKVESTGCYGPDGSVIAPGLGLLVSGELGVRPAGDGDNDDDEDDEEDKDDGQEIS